MVEHILQVVLQKMAAFLVVGVNFAEKATIRENSSKFAEFAHFRRIGALVAEYRQNLLISPSISPISEKTRFFAISCIPTHGRQKIADIY